MTVYSTWGFPIGECRGRGRYEQALGEVTADAVLIPDWLGSQRTQRYTAQCLVAERVHGADSPATRVPCGRGSDDFKRGDDYQSVRLSSAPQSRTYLSSASLTR
jgi:hypothetical protein